MSWHHHPTKGAHQRRRGRVKRLGKVLGIGKAPKRRLHQGKDNPSARFGAWVRFRVRGATPQPMGRRTRRDVRVLEES
jgi:hypothetical protein